MFTKELTTVSGLPVLHLDGDDLRKIFGNAYKVEDFTKEWRIDQTRTLQRFIAHINDQGISVVVSTVNPYRDVREEFKLSKFGVREIYVHTTNIRGREHFHAKDFEPPQTNFFDVDTTSKTPEKSMAELWTSVTSI
jgi:adenylylsulfate kinase-like enzyme